MVLKTIRVSKPWEFESPPLRLKYWENTMKPDWFALEQTFIWKVVSMFEWPFGSKNYGLGYPFSMDDAIKCIRDNLHEYASWRWDGEQIRLEGDCGFRSRPEFFGPIHSQGAEKLPQIEQALTEIYKAWSKPCVDFLIEKVSEAVNQLAVRGIPAEHITLHHPWSTLLNCKVLLGYRVERGERAQVFSSKRYSAFQDIVLEEEV